MFYFLSQITNIDGLHWIGLARGVGCTGQTGLLANALVVLVVAIGNTLWRENFPVGLAILLGLVLACLLFARPELYRTSFHYSWGGLLVDRAIYMGTFVVYTIIGISSFPVTITGHSYRNRGSYHPRRSG